MLRAEHAESGHTFDERGGNLAGIVYSEISFTNLRQVESYVR
jgi:hypothetical protein